MSEQQSEVPERAPSPLADALMRVGDRWTLLVVQALLAGPRRFNELLEDIPGIAANILSQRLKRLEHEALVVSRHGTARPVTTWWRTSPSLRCSFCSETPHNKVSTANGTFVPFWSVVLPRVTDMSAVQAERPTTDSLVLGLNEMPAVPAETVADNSPNLGCGPD